HEKAQKRTWHYLKATQNKGLILKPYQLKIDTYQDADFAGHHGYAKVTESECVKSRTGFLFTVSKCQIVWVSKL
ncbi:hypothetical protein ACHAW6_007875, partial [Cyclotella cf. meneghiniana]